MNVFVVATIYAWLAHGLAFLLLPSSIPLSLRVRAIAVWFIAAPLLFFVRAPLSILTLVGAILLMATPLAPRDRAAFFLAVVPAVPVFLYAPLPFPGINLLFEMTHLKIAALVLLLPLLFTSREPLNRPPTFNIADFGVPAYIIYTATIVIFAAGATNGMRFAFDQFLLIAVIYFALRAKLRAIDDINAFFQAFLVASVILASIAMISTYKHWDYYGIGVNTFTDVRNGAIRVQATANPHSLGFHLAAALFVLEFLRYRANIGWIKLNAVRAILLVGLMGTVSRGALGAFIVTGVVYLVIMIKGSIARSVTLYARCIGAVIGIVWFLRGDVAAVDAYGTFSYRQDLLWTSIGYIKMYPFWGDYFYLNSGYFNHLLQGQGIVDVTNIYLQFALQYGLVGLALMLFILIGPPVSLIIAIHSESLARDRKNPILPRRTADVATSRSSSAERAESSESHDAWRRSSAVAASVSVGWLFLVSTTSDVALTLYLGLVFSSICRALIDLRPSRTPVAALQRQPARRAASVYERASTVHRRIGDRLVQRRP